MNNRSIIKFVVKKLIKKIQHVRFPSCEIIHVIKNYWDLSCKKTSSMYPKRIIIDMDGEIDYHQQKHWTIKLIPTRPPTMIEYD